MRFMFLLSLFFYNLDYSFAKEAKVLKETPFSFSKDENGKLVVNRKRYTDYRPAWGKRISIISAEHSPSPRLLDQSRMPIQVEVSIIKNLKLISVGAEAGYMSVEWKNTNGGVIGMNNFYFGAVAHLDGLFSTPYVVPFFSAGGVSIDADIGGASIATEDVTFYYRAGLLFSLNWINRLMSLRAYDDFGLINSYIYVGMRKWMETNSDPNLTLELNNSIEFGLQLEF